MILLVSDIINDVMTLINATAPGETPTTSEYALMLRTANVMIDRWASQRLLLRSTSSLVIPLVGGKTSYTVGASGADVTASKPIRINSGYYRDSASLDFNVAIVSKQEYDNFLDKTVSTGPVSHVAYDAGDAQQGVQTGTVYVYLNPDQAYTLYLEVDNYLTEFSAITDTVSFEPAYYEALIYNLAVRAFRIFRDAAIPVPQEIVGIANNSLSNLRTMNSVRVVAGMELPGKVSKYNIYTDSNT